MNGDSSPGSGPAPSGPDSVPPARPEAFGPAPAFRPAYRFGGFDWRRFNQRNWRDGAQSLMFGLLIGSALLALLIPLTRLVQNHGQNHGQNPMAAASPRAPAAQAAPRQLDLGGLVIPPDVHRVATAIVSRADNGSLPFVVLDKRDAHVYVFEPSGRLLAASAALLGYAPGDDTVPGIGQRPINQVRPSERTTPAGRFVAKPGRNTLHEDVLWVDYDAAVSMHRVRVTDPKERRLERLASPSSADNRISYGCINLPVAFFEKSVWPTVRSQGAVVYVLPERKSLAEAFPTLLPAQLPVEAAAERQARIAHLI